MRWLRIIPVIWLVLPVLSWGADVSESMSLPSKWIVVPQAATGRVVSPAPANLLLTIRDTNGVTAKATVRLSYFATGRSVTPAAANQLLTRRNTNGIDTRAELCTPCGPRRGGMFLSFFP